MTQRLIGWSPTGSRILAQGNALGGVNRRIRRLKVCIIMHDLAAAYDADFQPAIQTPSMTQGGDR